MRKSFPMILLALVLVSVMLACILVACGPGEQPDTPTTESTTEDPTTEPDTTETETETEPGDTSTEESTTEPAVPEINGIVADFNAVSESALNKCFSGENQVEVTYGQDEDGEVYAVLTTTAASSDPFVNFSMTKFQKAAGMDKVKADDYKYVMLKVRSVGCSSGTFELFYCAGQVTGATGGIMTTASYDLENTGWQYVLFDLSAVNHWTGNVNGFRFDYMTGAQAAGETMHIAEIRFLESDDAYYKLFDIGWDEVGVIAGEQAKTEAEQLLGSVTLPTTKFDSYTPETAEKEDASLNLWFDHLYNRTPQATNTPSGKLTYQIQLAKNEIEGCQVLIGSENGAEGLKVYITDFTNEAGNTLTTQLFWGYYFNVEGERVIDPLPPVTYTPDQGMLDWVNGGNGGGEPITNLQKYDGFDIKAGENQAFIIKATSGIDSVPGEYTATLTVVDKDGNEVKKVTVFAYVWNFELPEATSCKTLMCLSGFDVYVSYKDWGGDLRNSDGKNLYKGYYDFLLANRVCAYDLPLGDNSDGKFSDSEAIEYLDNPRVVAFQPLGFSKELTASNVSNAYAFLSQKQEWLDKAYFYPVDEPLTVGRLDDINNYGKLLSENFPGYKLIVPMHVNYNVGGGDYFSYVSEYVNVWCPKTFFYNTFAEWYGDRTLTYGCSIVTEQKLGSFRDRMWAEQEGGDEAWWYVTRRPNDPEITLIINDDAINARTLFWQQKLYNVDGFLYYLVNDWTNGTTKWYVPSADEFYFGMDALHEIESSQNINVYGNGILLYSGVYFAQTDPVGSLRLECVRDGIEDYEYLTILEEKYGKEVVDAIINEWTTGVGEYSTDTEQFRELRAKLGALAEAAANE